MTPEISPVDAARRLRERDPAFVLLDIREVEELALARIAGARHIPMNEIPAQLNSLPRDGELAVICHTGGRSAYVVRWLAQQGFANVKNLAGGIDAWSVEVDPGIPRY